MPKTAKITQKTFEEGSVRDALIFLTKCVHNAFPEFKFRGLEVIKLVMGKRIVEGKSWNHEFVIRPIEENGESAWEVVCHRVSNGETADKKAILRAADLKPIK